MLHDNCRVGLLYLSEAEEVYISAPSLLNYLQVLEVDMRGEDNELVADVVHTVHQIFYKIVKDYEETIK